MLNILFNYFCIFHLFNWDVLDKNKNMYKYDLDQTWIHMKTIWWKKLRLSKYFWWRYKTNIRNIKAPNLILSFYYLLFKKTTDCPFSYKKTLSKYVFFKIYRE